MAEAAENKCKKRVRTKPTPSESSKKPKLDMHDAELFVDRIKVSVMCGTVSVRQQSMICVSDLRWVSQRRFAENLEKYERFLQILQVRPLILVLLACPWILTFVVGLLAHHQEYAKKERSLESVYERIGELFDGHADLQAEFVNFLVSTATQPPA
jgi:hypothetical protein